MRHPKVSCLSSLQWLALRTNDEVRYWSCDSSSSQGYSFKECLGKQSLLFVNFRISTDNSGSSRVNLHKDKFAISTRWKHHASRQWSETNGVGDIIKIDPALADSTGTMDDATVKERVSGPCPICTKVKLCDGTSVEYAWHDKSRHVLGQSSWLIGSTVEATADWLATKWRSPESDDWRTASNDQHELAEPNEPRTATSYAATVWYKWQTIATPFFVKSWPSLSPLASSAA